MAIIKATTSQFHVVPKEKHVQSEGGLVGCSPRTNSGVAPLLCGQLVHQALPRRGQAGSQAAVAGGMTGSSAWDAPTMIDLPLLLPRSPEAGGAPQPAPARRDAHHHRAAPTPAGGHRLAGGCQQPGCFWGGTPLLSLIALVLEVAQAPGCGRL